MLKKIVSLRRAVRPGQRPPPARARSTEIPASTAVVNLTLERDRDSQSIMSNPAISLLAAGGTRAAIMIRSKGCPHARRHHALLVRSDRHLRARRDRASRSRRCPWRPATDPQRFRRPLESMGPAASAGALGRRAAIEDQVPFVAGTARSEQQRATGRRNHHAPPDHVLRMVPLAAAEVSACTRAAVKAADTG